MACGLVVWTLMERQVIVSHRSRHFEPGGDPLLQGAAPVLLTQPFQFWRDLPFTRTQTLSKHMTLRVIQEVLIMYNWRTVVFLDHKSILSLGLWRTFAPS